MKVLFVPRSLLLALAAPIAVPAAPVILNEYNSVSSSNLLDAGEGEDRYFGTVAGNGGDWFELAVLGNGAAGSTVDLRGWTIEIHETNGATFDPRGVDDMGNQLGEVIVLSQDAFWSSVPAGSLLTFTEYKQSQGGLDTGLRIENHSASLGYTWSNIWINDGRLIDRASCSGFVYVGDAVDEDNSVSIGNDSTLFRILDAQGQMVFGPVGEGVSPSASVNSEEVFKLEADPATDIAPSDARYEDGSTSTFGAPNQWSLEDGSRATQNFSAFRTAPPSELFIRIENSGLSVTLHFEGVLQSSPDLIEPFEDVDGASSPFPVEAASGGGPYYRARPQDP